MPPGIAECSCGLTGHVVANVVEALLALLRPDEKHR
jgi:hypothetical protein